MWRLVSLSLVSVVTCRYYLRHALNCSIIRPDSRLRLSDSVDPVKPNGKVNAVCSSKVTMSSQARNHSYEQGIRPLL